MNEYHVSVRKATLADRVIIRERGKYSGDKKRLSRILEKFPYELFNGTFDIRAEFHEDMGKEFILLTQATLNHLITDINLPARRVELEDGFYWSLINPDFDIRIYERPLMEKSVSKYFSLK